MRKVVVKAGLLSAVVLCSLVAGGTAAAQTLDEALALAYSSNPTLNAARAELRGVDENVPQALAGYRPTVEFDAEAAYVSSNSDPGGGTELNQTDLTLTGTQPIYTGGTTSADVSESKNLVQAQRASLLSTEQTVLLDAATAYLDVVRDQALLELNINNEDVLRQQLQASRDRFEVGEITRTDVSQAEARLAGATSDRITSEGDLRASRATLERVVGQALQVEADPQPVLNLPVSLDEALALADTENPSVISAQFTERAAQDDVDSNFGELLPTLDFTVTLSRDTEPSSSIDTTNSATFQVDLTVPLYQAGSVTSAVRQAKQVASQRRLEIDEARRQVRENAISAWERLLSTRAEIQSRQAQVQANQIALEGVTQEATVGSRTTLDVLDAEQELLQSRVDLVTARRNELVAGYTLLSAVGRMTAQELTLPVELYDFTANYRRVRDKWWGLD